ncbi:efflux RND transporter permease subunit [Breoghania sp.]|uniref:efflux RND transporter permease subunit n=1 Tax=Breoghania sp. TaxID=2065378 RepID=UPI002AAB4947|nr:efflux RND transporter permease subunit [Breoghania sp.]
MNRLDRINGLASFFVRHPNAANLVMAMLVLFGIYGLVQLNTQFFPTIESNNISISVKWPGASAEDVEGNILQAIEPEVRYIDGVDEVVSYAREGVGSIQIEFVEGAVMSKALSDVEQAVKAVTTLPEDSETPTVSYRQWYDRVARIAISGDFPERSLIEFARKIRDDLIDRGIDRVSFNGLRAQEYVARIPERELRRLGMSVADVAERVAANTRDLPSGNVQGGVERQIRTIAPGTSPQDIGRIDIKTYATGEKVRIRDVGTVNAEFEEDSVRGFSNGLPAIELTIQRPASADSLKSAKILEDYLDEIRPQLPPTLNIVEYEARSDALKARIGILVSNGLSGLLIVVLVLYVFLNARIALWVAAGIPVATMATLGMMWVSGQTINMMSVFALIMMLGIIVDDAIVVGEHTATRAAMGDSAFVAAERGASLMFAPVIAASLTTVAAFAPIFLVRGAIGQIMSAMPLVVIAVLVASLIECFCVLPGHLAHALKPVARRGWHWWRHGIMAGAMALFIIGLAARPDIEVMPSLDGLATFARALEDRLGVLAFDLLAVAVSFVAAGLIEAVIVGLERRWRSRSDAAPALPRRLFDAGFARVRDGGFRTFVSLAFRWRYVTLSVALGALIVASGFVAGGRVGFVFFSSPEAENIRATVHFNAGIPEQEAVAALARIEQALRLAEADLTRDDKQDLVVASFVTLGEAGRNQSSNVAGIDVQLTDSEIRTIRTPEILKAWREKLPDIAGIERVAIFERRGGPPGRDIDVRLRGNDSASLKAASLEVQKLLTGFPGVSGVADDLPYGKPELVMELTARGKALGFTVNSVGRQIRNAFEGAIARRFAEAEEEITLRVRQGQTDEEGGGALRSLNLRAPSGEYVPLGEVVTLTDRQGFSTILRRDGKATVSVTADVDYDVTSNAAIVRELDAGPIADIAARHGVDYSFSGRQEERAESFADLKLGTIIAMGAIYLILAWVFASYTQPLIVMSIIPFGIVGAIVGHYVFGYKLTILSLISLLGLAGILVNNSIILVSRFNDRRESDEDIHEAAVGAAQDRLRAVLLTSLTTIGGLSPLLFEQSVQAKFLLPMAITIVFGLAVATLLILFIVPALLGVADDIRTAYRGIYGKPRDTGHAPAE